MDIDACGCLSREIVWRNTAAVQDMVNRKRTTSITTEDGKHCLGITDGQRARECLLILAELEQAFKADCSLDLQLAKCKRVKALYQGHVIGLIGCPCARQVDHQ